MDAQLIEVLKKWNIWERQIDIGTIRDDYIGRIYPYFERKEVIVLKGVRRSGKSTIMKQLMMELTENGINKKQILYLNLEDYSLANDLKIGLFEDVLNAYKSYSKNKKKVYFFIDEIQKIPGWEKWVRTKYDLNENIKFIVSGSSASLLSKELSTLLTGRNLSFRVMPLSFKEFLIFSHTKSFEEYLQFGGFPEVVLEKSEEKKSALLQQYFEDIMHKDIIDRYKIRNAKQLMDIARYLVSTSGSKVSSNKLSRVFGISKDTVSTYISYFIDSFLLFEVTFFSFSAKIKHDVSKLPKLYCIDNGLISAVTAKHFKNIGQKFENIVSIKLMEKFDEISYWSELKSEVDFVADKIAINVTATDRIPRREVHGLREFGKIHKDFKHLIISTAKSKNYTINILEFLSSNAKNY